MREENFWCKKPRYSEVRVIARRVIARYDCPVRYDRSLQYSFVKPARVKLHFARTARALTELGTPHACEPVSEAFCPCLTLRPIFTALEMPPLLGGSWQFCPNFQPRAHARLTGLTICSREWNVHLIKCLRTLRAWLQGFSATSGGSTRRALVIGAKSHAARACQTTGFAFMSLYACCCLPCQASKTAFRSQLRAP